MNKFSKEWHKSAKRLTQHGNKQGILNLQTGPIADRYDWKRAKEGKIDWLDVQMLTEEQAILQQNEDWVVETFEPWNALPQTNG